MILRFCLPKYINLLSLHPVYQNLDAERGIAFLARGPLFLQDML
jgi:hypothetical protein